MSNFISPFKPIQISIRPSLLKFLSFTLVIGSLLLSYRSVLFWYSDVQYQEGRKYRELLKDSIAALNQFERAIALHDQEPYYYCNQSMALNELLLRQHNNIEALEKNKTLFFINKAIDKCKELSINREHPLHLAAQVQFSLFTEKIVDSPEKAIELFTYISQLAPQHPENYFRLALLYFNAGNFELYEDNIKKCLHTKIDFLPAYIHLLDWFYQKNRTEDVKKLINQVLDIEFINFEFIPNILSLRNVSSFYKDTESTKRLTEFYERNKLRIEAEAKK